MLQSQIDQYNMLLAVENHFNDQPSAWNANTPIADTKTQLSNLIGEIGVQHAKQMVNTTGVTAAKNNKRKELEILGYRISAASSAYATIQQDEDLLRKVRYAESDFVRFQDAELIGHCENLYREADAIGANLGAYGVDAAAVTAFNTHRILFVNMMKDGETARGRTKSATEKLAQLLPQAIQLLKNPMDLLMVGLEASQAEFVSIYRTVRQIQDSPTHTLSLTTLCTDAITGLPVAKAKLRIDGGVLERNSGASGLNNYQHLSEGEHMLEATHPSYTTQLLHFIVVSGQRTELVISLVHK